jgi:hypothetical protein
MAKKNSKAKEVMDKAKSFTLEEIARLNDHYAKVYKPITNYSVEKLQKGDTPAGKAYLEYQEKAKQGFELNMVPGAIVTIPMNTNFRVALNDLFTYLLSTIETHEVITTLGQIGDNFKGLTEAEIDNLPIHTKAIWTTMSVINELNNQAALQAKLIYTEDKVDKSIEKLISNLNLGEDIDLSEEDVQAFLKYQSGERNSETPKFKEREEKSDDNKEENFDSEKKGKTSSED